MSVARGGGAEPGPRPVPPPEIEVRHLRRLVEIAEAGSLTAAAHRLGVPQARLADQVRRLELATGEALFVDAPSGLTPTRRGRTVIEEAREVLAELARLVVDARADAEPPLRIAGVDTLLGPTMTGVAASRPGLELVCEATAPADAVRAVADGRADVALTVRWPHVAWPRSDALVERRVGTYPLRVLLPATHRLAHRAVVDLAALRDETWCVRADPSSAAVPAECRRFGFEPDIRYRLSSDTALCDVVAAGHAVALTAHPVPSDPAIVSPRHRDAAAAHWVVVWRAAAEPPALADLIATVELWQAQRGWPGEDSSGRRPSRPVRIVAEHGTGVGPVVPQLRTVHGLLVGLEELAADDVAAALAEHRADLVVRRALRFLPERPPAGWRRTLVHTGRPLHVEMSVAHPAVGRRLDAADLARLRWTVPATGTARAAFDGLTRALDLVPQIGAVHRSPAEAARGTAGGELVRLSVDGAAPPSGAVLVPVHHPAARSDVLLLWRDEQIARIAQIVAGAVRRRPPGPQDVPGSVDLAAG